MICTSVVKSLHSICWCNQPVSGSNLIIMSIAADSSAHLMLLNGFFACLQLEDLHLVAPYLQTLNLSNCKKLSRLQLKCPELHFCNLSLCGKFLHLLKNRSYLFSIVISPYGAEKRTVFSLLDLSTDGYDLWNGLVCRVIGDFIKVYVSFTSECKCIWMSLIVTSWLL